MTSKVEETVRHGSVPAAPEVVGGRKGSPASRRAAIKSGQAAASGSGQPAVRRAVRMATQERHVGAAGVGVTVQPVRFITALLVPPYSVYRMKGAGHDFLLNVCLTLVGYMPGSVHATWVFLRASRAERARNSR